MPPRFSTILIPVDFTVNTDVAIGKALEICHKGPGSIHLYHVQPVIRRNLLHYFRYYLSGYSLKEINASISESQARLSKLKETIKEIKEDIDVFTSVSFGERIEASIANKASRLRADIVIIGKHRHHSCFPFLNTVVTSRLATSSGIAVLTVKPGSLNNEIKTVVIAVGRYYPEKKLEILEALRKKNRLHIRLVSFSDDMDDGHSSRQPLLDTFRAIKNHLSNPVDCEMLKGRNKARALLNYCKKTDADMLIVTPESETKIGRFMNKHISDLIPANSKTQVLAV